MPGGFTKDDFTIDLQARTVTCPAGLIATVCPAGQAPFKRRCATCPLRARCTTAKAEAGRVAAVNLRRLVRLGLAHDHTTTGVGARPVRLRTARGVN